MNDSKQIVFISSTYQDLEAHRALLIDNLHRMEIITKAMEYFGSNTENPKRTCLNELRECTLYIGIFGLCYGSIDDDTDKSYTQLEYEYALKLKIPMLIYMIDEKKQPILSNNIDYGIKAKKLADLKGIIGKNHTYSYFSSPDDLVKKVTADICKFLNKKTNYIESSKFKLNSNLNGDKRTSWEDYEGLFTLNHYKVAYIPIINEPGNKVIKYILNDIDVNVETIKYTLPKEFQNNEVCDLNDSSCCRLSSYRCENNKLEITVSETSYLDYLKSGEHLDDSYKNDPNLTIRDVYGNAIHSGEDNLRLFNLTNICGCGVFLITSDNIIVATKHDNSSKVYPGRLTYTSSGTMKYGAYPNPFTELLIKCRNEINYQINITNLELIGFGADTRKLYFQFSFINKINETYSHILEKCPDIEFKPIPCESKAIIDALINNCWEPAAEQTLLTLSSLYFGTDNTIVNLNKYKSLYGKRLIRDEWDYRASNGGYMSTLSIRYPQDIIAKLSSDYEMAVLSFMNGDINDKTILEVGSGDGRLSKHLIKSCKTLVCLDMCEKMNNRNKYNINSDKVKFITEFAQDYYTNMEYDVTIISLVLIHNVTTEDFEKVISNICKYCKVVYVFEDVSVNRKTSPYTKIRKPYDIIKVFAKNKFIKIKEEHYQLYTDDIIFVKFQKSVRR